MGRLVRLTCTALVLAAALPGTSARAASSTLRVGGLVRAVDAARHSITIFQLQPGTHLHDRDPAHHQHDDLQVPGRLCRSAPGDHLQVIGKADSARTASGPNPILARIVRVGSPSFGGVIATVAAASTGAVVLTLRGRHGHLLRIDASNQALVYTSDPSGKFVDTAHAVDLVAGEHIAARGSRVGKFELAATAIHVYPHQHTIGGQVVVSLAGQPARLPSPCLERQYLPRPDHRPYPLQPEWQAGHRGRGEAGPAHQGARLQRPAPAHPRPADPHRHPHQRHRASQVGTEAPYEEEDGNALPHSHAQTEALIHSIRAGSPLPRVLPVIGEV